MVEKAEEEDAEDDYGDYEDDFEVRFFFLYLNHLRSLVSSSNPFLSKHMVECRWCYGKIFTFPVAVPGFKSQSRGWIQEQYLYHS